MLAKASPCSVLRAAGSGDGSEDTWGDPGGTRTGRHEGRGAVGFRPGVPAVESGAGPSAMARQGAQLLHQARPPALPNRVSSELWSGLCSKYQLLFPVPVWTVALK